MITNDEAVAIVSDPSWTDQPLHLSAVDFDEKFLCQISNEHLRNYGLSSPIEPRCDDCMNIVVGFLESGRERDSLFYREGNYRAVGMDEMVQLWQVWKKVNQ